MTGGLGAIAITVCLVSVGVACESAGGAPAATAPWGEPPSAMSVVGRRFIAPWRHPDARPGDMIEIVVSADEMAYPVSCNWAASSYRVVDGVLEVRDGSTTLAACSEHDDLHKSFVNRILHASPTFVIDGDTLTISSGDEQLRLIDADAPNPADVPVAGTQWLIQQIVVQDTGGRMSIEGGTMRFTGGLAEVTFRCRTVHVPYVIDGDRRLITFEEATSELSSSTTIAAGFVRTAPPAYSTLPPMPATSSTTASPPPPPPTAPPSITLLPPCAPDPAPTEWELEVLAELTGQLTYEVDLGELRLRRADRSGLDLVAVP